MKELIIIIGTIILGIILFSMIAGDENSLKSTSAEKMEQLLNMYQEIYKQ